MILIIFFNLVFEDEIMDQEVNLIGAFSLVSIHSIEKPSKNFANNKEKAGKASFLKETK